MTTLTTEQQERVKALARKHGEVHPDLGYIDFDREADLFDFAAALLSELAPSLRVNPVAMGYLSANGVSYRIDLIGNGYEIKDPPLCLILPADQVTELIERKIEGGVYKAIANMADRWSDGRVPDGGGNALRNFAIAVRDLDEENAVRIAEIEGKT